MPYKVPISYFHGIPLRVSKSLTCFLFLKCKITIHSGRGKTKITLLKIPRVAYNWFNRFLHTKCLFLLCRKYGSKLIVGSIIKSWYRRKCKHVCRSLFGRFFLLLWCLKNHIFCFKHHACVPRTLTDKHLSRHIYSYGGNGDARFYSVYIIQYYDASIRCKNNVFKITIKTASEKL